MTWLDALKVGIAQCFALIPGTSRSGATIIGGMLFGLSRKAATEFSFFLAVPTLVAAGGYDLLKHRALFSASDLPIFGVGSVAAVRLGVRRDPLADPLRGDARLQAVRLVPDRVRDVFVPRVRLGDWKVYPCTQGRPALRQPPTVLRWCSASLSPSKPSRTL